MYLMNLPNIIHPKQNIYTWIIFLIYLSIEWKKKKKKKIFQELYKCLKDIDLKILNNTRSTLLLILRNLFILNYIFVTLYLLYYIMEEIMAITFR